MKRARVSVNWLLSESSDVTVQVLTVSNNGVNRDPVELLPNMDHMDLGLFDDGDLVSVTVVAKDAAGNESEPVSASFQVPDLTAPAPVSGLEFTYTVVDVVEE